MEPDLCLEGIGFRMEATCQDKIFNVNYPDLSNSHSQLSLVNLNLS